MLTLQSWPQAIVHLDADAFFASCEQALHPEYRGKPVITGKERGIVACPSYEAKERGVKRAMRLFEARRLCPEAIILPSDYETYSLISKRMFAIIRQFTPQVEEYSIDEGFFNLTGLRRIYKTSYENIAGKIKETIKEELGITVSVGLSLSKSLAKLASDRNKPSGFTPVPGRKIHKLLVETPVRDIWGFGPNTTALLDKMGITTAYQFVQKPRQFVRKLLGKIGDEIWRELRGEYVYPIISQEKTAYQSISKVKTFTPPSRDYYFIYAQLVRNLESACIKARRYKLMAKQVYLYLRLANFDSCGLEIKFSRPSNYPLELMPFIRRGFNQIFDSNKRYRATGIVLNHLISTKIIQPTLFDDSVKIMEPHGKSPWFIPQRPDGANIPYQKTNSSLPAGRQGLPAGRQGTGRIRGFLGTGIKMEKIFKAIDVINKRYGKHTVHLAASSPTNIYKRHQGERGNIPLRQENLLTGETKRQRLKYPMFFIQ